MIAPMPAPPSGDDDAVLMLRVRDGDVDAFEQLVEKHRHSVIGTATRMLGGGADAEDIAQQVFIRVWKSAPRYVATAKFTTWLMTILRNLVFNECRSRSRARLIPIDDQDDHPARQLPDTRTSPPGEAALCEELYGEIDAAIAALPENQRLAVILRRYEDMPYEDIAKVLKTSVPSVKSLLFRARGELKARLAAYLG